MIVLLCFQLLLAKSQVSAGQDKQTSRGLTSAAALSSLQTTAAADSRTALLAAAAAARRSDSTPSYSRPETTPTAAQLTNSGSSRQSADVSSRDLVTRIYREELLKLARIARGERQLAELSGYRQELARLGAASDDQLQPPTSNSLYSTASVGFECGGKEVGGGKKSWGVRLGGDVFTNKENVILNRMVSIYWSHS